MISVRNLEFSYAEKRVLQIPYWFMEQGEQCLFLGASGSGKTTLLHLLAGLLKPRQGLVEIAGTDLTTLTYAETDRFRGQHIGLVFQRNHLIQALSVEDNLKLAQYMSGASQDQTRINEVLEDLSLAGKRKAKTFQLSQGEAQRVSIARALLNKPKVILADEPTSSLDDTNCEKVVNLLQQQARKYQATLVISTHDGRIKHTIPTYLKLGA